MKTNFSSGLSLSLASFVLIMISTVLVNCSKSSDPALPSMIGTWKLSTTSTTGCNSSGNNLAESPCSSCPTVVINADNTYSTSGGSLVATSGTWSTGGLPVTQTTGAVAFNQTTPNAANQISYN